MMGIFKKIKTLYQSISVDVDSQIDKVNQECIAKRSKLEEGDITEHKKVNIERSNKLVEIGRSIGIAPEICPPFAKDELSSKIEGDQLENRIRYHVAHQHSLFWTIIAATIACASFFVSAIALILTICRG
jgi:hypothetical protein